MGHGKPGKLCKRMTGNRHCAGEALAGTIHYGAVEVLQWRPGDGVHDKVDSAKMLNGLIHKAL
jgi:hypothetical protein